ncbi:MAG TPA: DUF4180 domain-containing protein [Thermoanaerobaculia bacterium]|nr:DUF4180 domain-containing protein [Thermoanaerobaculia bacterium]
MTAADGPLVAATAADAPDLLAALRSCIESGSSRLLLERDALADSFFDLRTGIAGELLQNAANYGIRTAAVVPDLDSRPVRFRELALEAERGAGFRVFATRDEAIAWLASSPW